MPISESDKKVLLERLEKARIAKQAKAAEKKGATEKKALAPVPAPAPASVPEPTPEPVEEKPPASEPIDIPPVPDLVKASKKPAKKVSLPDSDSEEEAVMPKKKKTTKKDMPYMKIKLYKEPSNPEAFQQLLEAVNDQGEYDDEDSVSTPDPPKVYSKGPRVVQRVSAAPARGTPASKSIPAEDIKAAELRRLALEIFG
jgi:hypothetical protein